MIYPCSEALPVNTVRMYIEIPNQFQLSVSIFMCLQCSFISMYQIKCPSPTLNGAPAQPPSNFNLLSCTTHFV